MKCWLVIDLRANHFAPALLDLDSGKLRWKSQQFTIYPLPDIYNNVYETDLTFYQRPDETSWFPTLRSSVDRLPKEYKIVPALLDEPIVKLQTLITKTLGGLLKELLAEYKDLPLLFLIDRDNIRTLLVDFSNKVHRENTICLASDQIGDIEGFALLNAEHNIFPAQESKVSCVVNFNGNKAETLCYQWSHYQFKKVGTESTELKPISKWDSAADLNRAGFAIFSLVWEERLKSCLQNEIILFEQQRNSLSKILSHMDRILKQIDQVVNLSSI